MKFEIGNVVVLKSGGPEMTVEGKFPGYSPDTTVVTCTWFEDGKRTKAQFEQDALDLK